MTVLIFGASGQDGYYLQKKCHSKNMHCVALSRRGTVPTDVGCFESVKTHIQSIQPDYIFHFAAQSTTQHSALFENHHTISTGTLNILEAAKRYSPHSKIFITGSGVQFENHGGPISEQMPFAATSPYAVARIQSVFAARYYRSLGLRVYVGYLFHHESPLRKYNHVSQKIISFAKQVAAGHAGKLVLGDLAVQKEWAFAGDIVDGIWALLQQNQVFEAAIGTGITYSIQDWVELCFKSIGRNWQDHIEIAPNFISEYRSLVSDPTTLFRLGWRPTTPFSELNRMMMHAPIEEPV